VTSLVYWHCRSVLYMSCTYNSLKKPKFWLSLTLVLSLIIKINDFWGPIMDKTPWFQWCLTPYNDSLFTQTLNNTNKCNLQGDWKRVNILNHVCWSHFRWRKHPIFSLPTFDMTPKLQNLSHVPKFNLKKNHDHKTYTYYKWWWWDKEVHQYDCNGYICIYYQQHHIRYKTLKGCSLFVAYTS